MIAACHTARLAENFGRGVRRLLLDRGLRLDVQLRAEARSAGHFLTHSGGEYFAIGTAGTVTGRRADLALIDDPVSSFLEANSIRARDRLWNWYRAEFLTRLKPKAKTLVVMTRWHSDDLAGRLLQCNDWSVICLPAIAEDHDPLGRIPGEALWPEWEDRDALIAKHSVMGDLGFAALFQQTPRPEGGLLFNVAALSIIDAPIAGTSVRAWDLAATCDPAADPDWTVGIRLTRTQDDKFIVEDVIRSRVGPGDVDRTIRAVAVRDGTAVPISLPQDPGQAGKYQINTLVRALAGFSVKATRETGNKITRAWPVAAQVAHANVALRRGDWNAAFVEELAAFPYGNKDDQVDALSRAFEMLAPMTAPAKFTALPYFGR